MTTLFRWAEIAEINRERRLDSHSWTAQCQGNHRDTIVAAVGIAADGDQNTVGQAIAELDMEPNRGGGLDHRRGLAEEFGAEVLPRVGVRPPGWQPTLQAVEARAAACQIDTLRRTADDA